MNNSFFICIHFLLFLYMITSINYISMNNYGVKKVGHSVIDIIIPQSQEQISGDFFQRISIGLGIDDRDISENDHLFDSSITKLSKSFQQHSLIMTLESVSYGITNKLKRIESASAVEGILTSSSIFNPRIINSSKLNNGGLMKDWDF